MFSDPDIVNIFSRPQLGGDLPYFKGKQYGQGRILKGTARLAYPIFTATNNGNNKGRKRKHQRGKGVDETMKRLKDTAGYILKASPEEQKRIYNKIKGFESDRIATSIINKHLKTIFDRN